MAVTIKEIQDEWYHVELIRGIPMKYRGKDLYFKKVHLREAGMDDFDNAGVSAEATTSERNEAAKKIFVLVGRVIAEEGYSAEDKGEIEKYSKIQRKIYALENKIVEEENEAVVQNLQDEIEGLRKGLPNLESPFAGDNTILTYTVENLSVKKMKPVDFVRMTRSFQEVNMLENEDVEAFLTLPGS